MGAPGGNCINSEIRCYDLPMNLLHDLPMPMQNKCADAAAFPAAVICKERTEKLATSSESIAKALYQKPARAFGLESALSAFSGVRPPRG